MYVIRSTEDPSKFLLVRGGLGRPRFLLVADQGRASAWHNQDAAIRTVRALRLNVVSPPQVEVVEVQP